MNILNFILSIKFLFVLWLVLIYLLYLIWDKENKLAYNDKYYEQLPNTYSPAKMKALVNYGRLYPKDLVAEVMNLIFKGFLVIKTENNKIVLAKSNSLSNLTSDESFLINWLFSLSKNKESLDIRYLLKPNRQILKDLSFRKQFKKWNKEVNESLKEQKLFCSKKTPLSLGIILSLVYIALAILLSLYFNRLLYLILLILPIITLLYSLNIIKRTPKGQKEYALWMAFKRYLKDINNHSNALMPLEVESFLPYAVSLGVQASVFAYLKNNAESLPNSKFLNQLSVEEAEKLINKVLKSAELSIISTDFE